MAHAKSRNPTDGGSIHASGRLRDPFEATAHLIFFCMFVGYEAI